MQALHIEPVPLRAVITEALELVAIEARRRGIAIRTIGVEESTACVSADRFRLRQALINLLTNAIKYSPVDGAVSISTRPVTGARTRVTVTDSGPGIAPELLPRLFQSFDRLGAERTGVAGTGLGLALYRRIVELLTESPGLRPEDIFISLVEVLPENWSLGHGEAQYAPLNVDAPRKRAAEPRV